MAIATIISGMSSAEIISAVNGNAALVLGDYDEITSSMDGVESVSTLNTNLDTTGFSIGMLGSSLVALLNTLYATYDISLDAPTDVVLTWEQDYCKIDFTDNSAGQAKHEIWERQTWVNTTGNVIEDYVLRQTLNEGVESLNLKTWQNSTLDFRIRAVKDNNYSPFPDKVTINTPQFIFRTDQTTLDRITIYKMLSIATTPGVGTNNINWGDGSDGDYSYEDENAIFHDYAVEGIYWITITGDPIQHFEFYEQPLSGTDVTYWQIPAKGFFCHFWSNGLVGDISNWHPPYNIAGLHLETNNIISSCIDWIVNGNYTVFYDCHLSDHYINASNAGNLQTRLPKIAHLNLRAKGDISSFIFPKNTDYRSWMFSIGGNEFSGDISNLCDGNYQYLHSVKLYNNKNITGDLSGWFLGGDYGVNPSSVDIHGNQITGLLRGNFYKCTKYLAYDNNCDSDEIDAFLAAVDASVTANAPQFDCTYNISGTGMGIPSAAGLTSKSNIEGKYTTAGFTATIVVNS